MSAMKRNFIFIILLLALFTGQAEAQRRLPRKEGKQEIGRAHV